MSKYHEKNQIMQDHIAAWQCSNLTQTDYCKSAGLKLDNFNYYKKKFIHQPKEYK